MKHTKEKMMKALVLALIEGKVPADESLIPPEYRLAFNEITKKHVIVFSLKEIDEDKFKSVCQNKAIVECMVFQTTEFNSISLDDEDENIIGAIISETKLI